MKRYGRCIVACLWIAHLLIACGQAVLPSRVEGEEVPMPPIYPGAQQKHIIIDNGGADNIRIIIFRVDSTAESILDFYQEALPQNGWTFHKKYLDGDVEYNYYGHPLLSYDLRIHIERKQHISYVELRQLMKWTGHSGHGWTP
jgi:hypothetical protein